MQCKHPWMKAAPWPATALLLSAALLTSPAAHAQAGAACQPTGTVAEVNACAVQDFQAADTTIQILY